MAGMPSLSGPPASISARSMLVIVKSVREPEVENARSRGDVDAVAARTVGAEDLLDAAPGLGANVPGPGDLRVGGLSIEPWQAASSTTVASASAGRLLAMTPAG